MSKKLYIAIDVQNDFISGSLGSEKAQEVTPKIADFLSKVKDKEDTVGIWATRDTHKKDTYFKSLEGEKLPVEHCIKDTHGWEIDDRVKPFIDEKSIWDKETFMCEILAQHIQYITSEISMYLFKEIDEIVLMGFCTGICVASNAIYLRGLMPDMKITVLEDLCACVTEDTHKAALTTMGCCQIDIEDSESFLKMYYNSYAKRAREQFANKVTVITCPEDVELASYNLVFAIPVFLAGGITNCEEWQKTVINYFKENWKHERGIIFLNPRRDSFDVTNPNATREQIEWEFKYLNTPHVLFSMYFSNSPSPQPICFYEMGRALGKEFEIDAFNNLRINDVFVATHKDFHRKADVLIQGELADYGSIPSEVDSAKHYAQLLMEYIENNYDLSIPMESSLTQNCAFCKYFSAIPTHGSSTVGDCLKKENMVWCSPNRYSGRHKDYKTVSDDDVCNFFESKTNGNKN